MEITKFLKSQPHLARGSVAPPCKIIAFDEDCHQVKVTVQAARKCPQWGSHLLTRFSARIGVDADMQYTISHFHLHKKSCASDPSCIANVIEFHLNERLQVFCSKRSSLLNILTSKGMHYSQVIRKCRIANSIYPNTQY